MHLAESEFKLFTRSPPSVIINAFPKIYLSSVFVLFDDLTWLGLLLEISVSMISLFLVDSSETGNLYVCVCVHARVVWFCAHVCACVCVCVRFSHVCVCICVYICVCGRNLPIIMCLPDWRCFIRFVSTSCEIVLLCCDSRQYYGATVCHKLKSCYRLHHQVLLWCGFFTIVYHCMYELYAELATMLARSIVIDAAFDVCAIVKVSL